MKTSYADNIDNSTRLLALASRGEECVERHPVMWLVRSVSELVRLDPWFSVVSASFSALAVCGLALDLGPMDMPDVGYITVLFGSCMRWMSAVRMTIGRSMPWSAETMRLERRTVIVVTLLHLAVCGSTAGIILGLGGASGMRPEDLALAIALITLAAALIGWFRAPTPW